jgi:hypothetical protein
MSGNSRFGAKGPVVQRPGIQVAIHSIQPIASVVTISRRVLREGIRLSRQVQYPGRLVPQNDLLGEPP